jgi:hypothetical protein
MHSQPSFETLSHPPSGNADEVAKSLFEAQDKAKALFENTMLTYYDQSEDRRIADDDVVYLDFGPVFEAWEFISSTSGAGSAAFARNC